MFFSIIVPIYNVELYIEKTIRSVLSQTYCDYELILVDDGSTDSSPLICNRWSAVDNRIRVIHKTNGGVSDARNAGLDVAVGKYVLFIDGDDYWAENSFLQELHNRIEERTSDIIVYTGKVESENGQLRQLRGEHDLEYIRCSSKDSVLEYLIKYKKFPGACWIFCTKHSLIQSLNLRFVKGVTAEDYMWITTLMFYAKSIDALNITVYRYVQHRGSLSKRFNIHTLEGLTNSIINWMKIDDKKKYPCMYEYHQRVFVLTLRCWGRMSANDRKKGERLLKQSKRILEYPYNHIVLALYKILGPFILGNIIYYLHMIWKRTKRFVG